jgi:hypothetical protein
LRRIKMSSANVRKRWLLSSSGILRGTRDIRLVHK